MAFLLLLPIVGALLPSSASTTTPTASGAPAPAVLYDPRIREQIRMIMSTG